MFEIDVMEEKEQRRRNSFRYFSWLTICIIREGSLKKYLGCLGGKNQNKKVNHCIYSLLSIKHMSIKYICPMMKLELYFLSPKTMIISRSPALERHLSVSVVVCHCQQFLILMLESGYQQR